MSIDAATITDLSAMTEALRTPIVPLAINGRPLFVIHVQIALADLSPRERWKVTDRGRRIASRFGCEPVFSEPLPPCATT